MRDLFQVSTFYLLLIGASILTYETGQEVILGMLDEPDAGVVIRLMLGVPVTIVWGLLILGCVHAIARFGFGIRSGFQSDHSEELQTLYGITETFFLATIGICHFI